MTAPIMAAVAAISATVMLTRAVVPLGPAAEADPGGVGACDVDPSPAPGWPPGVVPVMLPTPVLGPPNTGKRSGTVTVSGADRLTASEGDDGVYPWRFIDPLGR